MAKHALYRYFDPEGLLLYVGISGSLGAREATHIRRAPWMELAARSTIERVRAEDVAEAERQAIRAEGPLFNVKDNDDPLAAANLLAYLARIGRQDLMPTRLASVRRPEGTAAPTDLAEYEAIRAGLAAAAARRELAEKRRADAMRETGALMRRARALAAREPSLKVDVTDAAAVTGLSRPTLYSLAAQETAPGDSRDYAGMSDAGLAAAHVAYGYELTGPRAEEFAARFPEVEALRHAAGLLAKAQGQPPLSEWPGKPAPGPGTLLRAYEDRVRQIAADAPGAARRSP